MNSRFRRTEKIAILLLILHIICAFILIPVSDASPNYILRADSAENCKIAYDGKNVYAIIEKQPLFGIYEEAYLYECSNNQFLEKYELGNGSRISIQTINGKLYYHVVNEEKPNNGLITSSAICEIDTKGWIKNKVMRETFENNLDNRKRYYITPYAIIAKYYYGVEEALYIIEGNNVNLLSEGHDRYDIYDSYIAIHDDSDQCISSVIDLSDVNHNTYEFIGSNMDGFCKYQGLMKNGNFYYVDSEGIKHYDCRNGITRCIFKGHFYKYFVFFDKYLYFSNGRYLFEYNISTSSMISIPFIIDEDQRYVIVDDLIYLFPFSGIHNADEIVIKDMW